jgi:hypothetical protein
MPRKFKLLLLLVVLLFPIQSQAQTPVFTSNFYNPCGNDGNNEFLVGQASATTAFNPMKLSYFVSGANSDGSGRDSIYQDAFCSSLSATGSGSNACNGAGWTKSLGVGSGSHRILNYTNATDKLKVDSVIARLNYLLASCSGGACSNTFIAPDPVTGEIPANGKFVFLISQGINDTAVGASNSVNFCGFCNSGPFYVIVGSFPAGTSGLVTNTYTATTTRYISLAYDQGGASGLAEIYSYIHIPATSSVSGRNYFQFIPQGINSLNNTVAQNAVTTDCNIIAGVALPITLTSLTGKYTADNKVQLNWETASEEGIDRFNIERSSDAINYATIGSVKAKGDRSTMAQYVFTDFTPPSGKSYYRLAFKGIDGQLEYSRVIIVSTSGQDDGIRLYPNPATNYINLETYSQKFVTAFITISNTSGKILYRSTQLFQSGVNKSSISLKEFSSGIYYLRLQTDKGLSNYIIIKQ